MAEYVNIETGEVVTEEKLRKEFHQFAVENPETYDGMSFTQYMREALDKNGSLREEKEEIYYQLCRTLTDYEEGGATEKDLYSLLVLIQNRWEEITGGES